MHYFYMRGSIDGCSNILFLPHYLEQRPIAGILNTQVRTQKRQSLLLKVIVMSDQCQQGSMKAMTASFLNPLLTFEVTLNQYQSLASISIVK